jgi:alkane 1-monooxygenase
VTRSFWATFPFWIAFLLPPLIVICVYNRGWFAVVPIVVVFVLLPAIDALSGVAERSREAPDLAFNNWFRVVTWAWVPTQVTLLAWLVRTERLTHLTTLEVIAATISVGATTGAIGMTFAHELIHRRHGYERTMGNILLASVTYPHFAIEHVKGHHRHVGTPRDPATARLGESVYRFLPRTVLGGLAGAWRIERTRLADQGRRTWSTQNLMLRYALLEVVIYGAIALAFGGIGLAVFAGQSAVAIAILEIINYVEHYGLQRKKDKAKPSVYEPIRPEDSWDSPSRVSNWLLINLPRHSDHHLSVAKRYQSLELLHHAPRLPGGYGAMFLLALVPPLWFHVMNPRVDAVRRGAPI